MRLLPLIAVVVVTLGQIHNAQGEQLFDAQQAVHEAGADYGSASVGTRAEPKVPSAKPEKLRERIVVICKPENFSYGKGENTACEIKHY
jgi:hypothetical protein